MGDASRLRNAAAVEKNWKRSRCCCVFAVEQQSRSLFKIETNAQGKEKRERKRGHTHTHTHKKTKKLGSSLSSFREGSEKKREGRK